MLNKYAVIILSLFIFTACEGGEASYPKSQKDIREAKHGKLTGEGLFVMGGAADEKKAAESGNPLGVNSYLWRATLDTVAFMPLVSADPFGGVIITDWYEDPDSRGERFKINAFILSRQLRADGVKASIFKQKYVEGQGWVDEKTASTMERQLEDTILTRARQMRINQSGS